MQRAKVASVAAPVVLVTAGWWFGVWSHQSDQQADFNAAADRATSSAQAARIELRAADRFGADLATGAARLQQLRAALPTSSDIGGFVADNETAASNAGVVVAALDPDAPDAKAEPAPRGLKATGIDVTVTGDPTAVTRYLDELMTMPRAVAVDSFSTSGQGTAQASMTVRIRVFHRPSA